MGRGGEREWREGRFDDCYRDLNTQTQIAKTNKQTKSLDYKLDSLRPVVLRTPRIFQ